MATATVLPYASLANTAQRQQLFPSSSRKLHLCINFSKEESFLFCFQIHLQLLEQYLFVLGVQYTEFHSFCLSYIPESMAVNRSASHRQSPIFPVLELRRKGITYACTTWTESGEKERRGMNVASLKP
jgi:hypothetical protein